MAALSVYRRTLLQGAPPGHELAVVSTDNVHLESYWGGHQHQGLLDFGVLSPNQA